MNTCTYQKKFDPIQGFPKTKREFRRMFPTEVACRDYLVALRWPNGFECPSCGSRQDPWIQTRDRRVCPTCRHQVSVTAGTVLDKTRTELMTWFDAAWQLTSKGSGVSAMCFGEEMGISYQSAWAILQRLRMLYGHLDRERLAGAVEVGIVRLRGLHGLKKKAIKGPVPRTPVAIAVETGTDGPQKVWLRHLVKQSRKGFKAFLDEAISPDAIITMDCVSIEKALAAARRDCQSNAEPTPASPRPPGVALLSYKLRYWLGETHLSILFAAHLQPYLDEFSFRFNATASLSNGKLFQSLLKAAITSPPIRLTQIRRSAPKGKAAPIEPW